MVSNPQMATSNLPVTTTASTSCKSCKKWGVPCPLCICLASPPSHLESKRSDEVWNGDRHREREERKKGKQEKEVEKNKKEDSVQKTIIPKVPHMTPTLKKTPYQCQ